MGASAIKRAMKPILRSSRTLIAAAALLAATTCTQSKQSEPAPVSPVPLAKWQPEEAKLLGEKPVTCADLPAEWQKLSDAKLKELLDEIAEKAKIFCVGHPLPGMNCDHEASLRYASQMRYIALILDYTPHMITSLYEISDNLRRQWKLKEAIRYAQVGIRECETAGESLIRPMAELYKLLGWEYAAVSEYNKAFDSFRKSYDAYATRNDHTGLVNTTYSIADLYYRLGLTEEALERFQHCLQMSRDMENLVYEGFALGSIGSVYYDYGNYERALKYLSESVETLRHQPPRYWRGLGESLAKIGDVYRRLEKYEEGLAYCEEAARVLHEGDFRRREALVTTTLGDLYRDSGHPDMAVQCYNKAVSNAREIGASSEHAHALAQRARLRYESSDYASAKGDLRQAFSIYSAQATQFTWESGLKGGLAARLHDIGSLLAKLQIELGEFEQALQTVESFKSSSLLQLLAQAKTYVRDAQVQQTLNDYRSANAYLQTLQKRLQELPGDTENNEPALDERSRIIEQIEEYTRKADDAWAFVQKRNPRIAKILQIKGISASDIQQEVLHRNQVLLDYLLTEDSVTIFALPKSGKLAVTTAKFPALANEGADDDWITRQVAMLYDPRKAKQNEAGRALYDLLLAPISHVLSKESHLIICPDGALFSVPFDALIDHAGHLVLDKHAISYSSSATMLTYASSGQRNRDTLVAGVSFSKTKLPGEVGIEASQKPSSTLATRNRLTPLPGVHRELESVGKILGATPRMDAEVTESWLKDSLPGKRVVHLATHGRLSSIPLLNGIYAYQQESPERAFEPHEAAITEDGFLSMCEVMGIPMDGCELIVLSCCHSFEGNVSAGEGLMGISQGYLYAGANAIIASLAQVNDDATRELMVQFYRNWWENQMLKSEALRAAKQSLARSDRFADPRFWSPFVLYGLE